MILICLAYSQAAGIDYPPREGSSVALFTPPSTHQTSTTRPISTFEGASVQVPHPSGVSALRFVLAIVDIHSL